MRARLMISWLLSGLTACKSPGTHYREWASLQRYAQENARLGAPAAGEQRVVFLGDSITEWWQREHPNFFAGRPYINRGISGQTTGQIKQRFRDDVIALKPVIVVILAGINDIAENQGPVPVEKMADNITDMAALAIKHQIRPVICSVLPASRISWREGIRPVEKITQLNTLLAAYCREKGITYVDYYTKMVNGEKGLDRQLATDGVHPTQAGYRLIEPLVEAAIAENMPEAVQLPSP